MGLMCATMTICGEPCVVSSLPAVTTSPSTKSDSKAGETWTGTLERRFSYLLNFHVVKVGTTNNSSSLHFTSGNAHTLKYTTPDAHVSGERALFVNVFTILSFSRSGETKTHRLPVPGGRRLLTRTRKSLGP